MFKLLKQISLCLLLAPLYSYNVGFFFFFTNFMYLFIFGCAVLHGCVDFFLVVASGAYSLAVV